MPRKQEPIPTVSYVRDAEGNEYIFGSDDPVKYPPHPFTPEQRREIGTRLALTYLNELCRGQAEFYRKDKQP